MNNSEYNRNREFVELGPQFVRAAKLYDEVYNSLSEKIINFAESKLEGHLLVTDYMPEKFRKQYLNPTKNPILSKDVLGKLNKELSVTAFGEYADACVFQWTEICVIF